MEQYPFSELLNDTIDTRTEWKETSHFKTEQIYAKSIFSLLQRQRTMRSAWRWWCRQTACSAGRLPVLLSGWLRCCQAGCVVVRLVALLSGWFRCCLTACVVLRLIVVLLVAFGYCRKAAEPSGDRRLIRSGYFLLSEVLVSLLVIWSSWVQPGLGCCLRILIHYLVAYLTVRKVCVLSWTGTSPKYKYVSWTGSYSSSSHPQSILILF